MRVTRTLDHKMPGAKRTVGMKKMISVLTEFLADGEPKLSADVHAHLKNMGMSRRHLYEAKKIIGIEIHRDNKGGATWQMGGAAQSCRLPDVVRSTEILKSMAHPTNQSVADRLAKYVPQYDPIVALAQIASDHTTPLAVRIEIHSTLAKYIVPQVKATEITSTDQPIALNFKWEH